MENYIRFVVRYRFFVLGLLLLITLLSGVVLSNAKLSGSMGEMFLGESPEFLRYMERVKEFGSDSFIIIAFEEENLFSKQSIDKLKAVVGKIEDIPKVKRVQSILDLQDVQMISGMPTAKRYVDIALKQPERSDEILNKLRSDPLIGGLLISKDGRHSMVVIEILWGEKHVDQDLPPLVGEILKIFEEGGFERSRLHQGGGIPILVEMLNQILFNFKRLTPIVCLVLFLTVYLLFQKFWPVFITLIVTLIGVNWTMGFGILLFGKINIMTAMVPGIILIIAFSDVVHLCSSYHMEISKGERKEQAIEKSCTEVGTACLFTSITTFFGFISLALVPAPAYRQFGIILGVGVGLALIIAMTLTPIIFSLMRAPKPLRVGATSKAQRLLYKAIDFVVHLTRKRPWVIVTAFGVLLVLTIVGVMRIEFEKNIVKNLAEDNPIRADSRYFSEHFDGTNYLDIFIEAPEPNGILKPEILSRVSAFQNSLLSLSEVDRVMSIGDLFNHIHRLFNPGSAKGNVQPMTEEDISQYLFMFKMSGSDDLKSMIDVDNRTIRLRLHLNDNGFFAASRARQKALDAAQAVLGDKVQIEVTGITALFGEFVEDFIAGQQRGLIFAFFAILIMMAIALRSFTGGLWSMLPNMIPLLFLGGYVGWFWDIVDSDVIMVGIIAIGISVDDTIHFLFRYRFELDRTKDMDIALDRTFHFSGRALIITSVIIVAGFAPFAFADYFFFKIMGTLLPATLAAAMVTDLLLIPAMIKLGAFKFRTKARSKGLK
ncbi:RND family transporter [Thermodesulfobacteriota bacterium]